MTTTAKPRDAADYEALRSQAQLIGFRRAAELLPLGLATWLTTALRSGPWPMPRSSGSSSWPELAMGQAGPLPALLASIVWRVTEEAAHA